jgi:hypothetical protein
MTRLPAEVVKIDHELEASATKASEALVSHRWHWTLDESNPGRVAIREYARQIVRAYSTVYKQVHGFANPDYRAGAITLDEATDRANMGAEREAATEAVAEARGLAFRTARESRPTEVKRVREIARERAERKGTTVEEEAPRVAESIVRTEKAEARVTEERKARHSLRYVSVEGKLARMYRIGEDALKEAEDVGFDDEERELLAETVGKLRALLNLIDMRFAGTVDVDWDGELAKIAGESS